MTLPPHNQHKTSQSADSPPPPKIEKSLQRGWIIWRNGSATSLPSIYHHRTGLVRFGEHRFGEHRFGDEPQHPYTMASYTTTVSYEISQVTDDLYKLHRVVESSEIGDYGERNIADRRILLTTGDLATVTRLYAQVTQQKGDEVEAPKGPPTPPALDNKTLTAAIHDLEARLMIVEAELAERKQQEIATPSVAKSFRQYAINTMGRLIR